METIDKIAKELKRGKVIVCPTDTVYGLVTDATNKKAVDKIFGIKKRSRAKPLPIFVKDLKMAKKFAKINKNQEEFLKEVWPGKTTVVLKRKVEAKLYGVDDGTIALRIPKYKLINDLLEKTKLPLTGTSANISGKPAATEIKEVFRQFRNKKSRPDLIVDEGDLKPAKPSTIIDLTGLEPKILRK